MGNEIDITPYVIPKIANAVLSGSKITFIYGWRDGGKSSNAFRVLIWKCLLDKHFRWAHCRAKYNEIQGSTFQTIQDEIKAMHLQDYFIVTKDKFKIINKRNPDNYFFGASADQPDKIRSTPNLNGYIVDEAHDITEKDFASLTGTLRENEMINVGTKAVYIFNNDMVSTKTFLYKAFFDPNSPMYNKVERVMVNYHDNKFVNQERTREKLMMVVLNDESKYNSLMAGEFMEEKPLNPFITAMTDRLFNPELSFDPRLPIWASFDINNDPLTCVLSQCSEGQHSKIYGFIRTFDEFKVSKEELIKYHGWDKYMVIVHLIRNKYPNSPVFITGDMSGWQGNPMFKADEPSMYIYVSRLLRSNPETMLKTPRFNLKHTVSKTLINSALSFHPQIQVNPNTCPVLASEIHSAHTDENGQLVKNRETSPLDSFDAWRYQIATMLYPYWLKNASELM